MKTRRPLFKAIAIFCALAMLLLCFAACSTPEEPKTEENYRYGRYVEQDITPEGLTGQDANMYADASGWIDIVVAQYDGGRQYMRYTSMDYGGSWEKTALTWLKQFDVYHTIYDSGPQTEPNIILYAVVPQKNGDLLVVVNWQYPEGDEEYKTLRFSKTGEETSFDIALPEAEGYDSQVTGLSYLPGGRLLYYAASIPHGGEYGRDGFYYTGIADADTGESIASFEGLGGGSVFYNSTTLFIENLNADEVRAFLLADGTEVDTPLTPQALNSLRQGNGSMDGSYQVLADDANTLYAVSRTGMKEMAADATEPALLMDALAYSFGSPIYSLFATTSTVVLGEGDFLMLLYNTLDGSDKVVRLAYDAQALAYTGESLHVFSLYDGEDVRQIIAAYQRQHPEIEVVYEAGMGLGKTKYDAGTEGGIVTEADVIQRLNTEVLTGRGPDVIFLDGLPFQSYAAKGALADLTDVLQQAGVVQEIATAMQVDGKNYYAPACVALPALVGTREDLALVSDLEGFFAAVENGPAPQRVPYREDMTPEERQAYREAQDRVLPAAERPLVDFEYWPNIYAMLYHVAAPGLYAYGESINRENLESFCRAMQYITDAYVVQDLNSESSAYELKGPLRESNGEFPYFVMGTYPMLANRARLGMVELSTFDWVPRIARDQEQAKTVYVYDEEGNSVKQPREGHQAPELALAPMPGFGGGGVCIPKILMGVNAVSTSQALAQDFVRTAYTVEVQRYFPYRYERVGLPVVEAVLADMENAARAQPVIYGDWTGEALVDRELAYPADIHFTDVLAGVRQAYIPDDILEESVFSNVLQLCQGKITLEQAVDNIVEDTATYFAEQQ